MKRNIVVAISTLLMYLPCLVGYSSSPFDTPHPKVPILTEKHLDDLLTNFDEIGNLLYFPWPYKIRELCMRHDIPCGIEESPDDPIYQISFLSGGRFEEKLELGFKITKKPVREVLDIILSKHPHYQLEIQDGVLNIVPKPGHEYRRWWKPILSKRFRRYDIDDERAGTVLLKACYDAGIPVEILPISALLTVNPPKMPLTDKISLHLKNVTVRQVLNAAVRADSQAIWKFAYDPEKRVYSIKVDSWGRAGYFAIPW